MFILFGSLWLAHPAEEASDVASRWTAANGGLEVTVTTAGVEEHDVAREVLLCLGQGLWELRLFPKLTPRCSPRVTQAF